jgi:hypothetical protein
MIEIIPDLPPGAVGFKLSGKVDAAAYKATIEPAVQAAQATGDKVNALIVIGDDGVDLSPGAMWEDAKLGLAHPRSWNKVALVGQKAWWDTLVPVLSALMPGEFQTFPPEDLVAARAWLAGSA